MPHPPFAAKLTEPLALGDAPHVLPREIAA
jgi:hypothetical protein